MSKNTNNHIISIYNSRKNLLDILEKRGFDVSSYNNFTINEIGIMLETNQLDIFLEKMKKQIKRYI